jgi:hypothetical protein
MIGLMWRFDRKRPISPQLADALARHKERTGQVATHVQVAPGELLAADGLTVTESWRVSPGTWFVGDGA